MNGVQLAHLRAMYPDLDGWRERSRRLEQPEPGSDMARDTAATHGMGTPFHDLARHQLVSATQHLNLARVGVEAREVFPIAHPTVLRGALLGASRGVWLLHSPDAAVRRARGARVALEMHRRLLEWVEEPENELADEGREEARGTVEARIADLEAREGVGEVKHWDTAVIRQAGKVVFSEAHQRGAVVALWRQLSGDAHSLVWPNMTRASTVRVRAPRDAQYPLPMNQLTSGGDLRELVNEFSAAFRILKVGWSLFDQRCTAS